MNRSATKRSSFPSVMSSKPPRTPATPRTSFQQARKNSNRGEELPIHNLMSAMLSRKDITARYLEKLRRERTRGDIDIKKHLPLTIRGIGQGKQSRAEMDQSPSMISPNHMKAGAATPNGVPPYVIQREKPLQDMIGFRKLGKINTSDELRKNQDGGNKDITEISINLNDNTLRSEAASRGSTVNLENEINRLVLSPSARSATLYSAPNSAMSRVSRFSGLSYERRGSFAKTEHGEEFAGFALFGDKLTLSPRNSPRNSPRTTPRGSPTRDTMLTHRLELPTTPLNGKTSQDKTTPTKTNVVVPPRTPQTRQSRTRFTSKTSDRSTSRTPSRSPHRFAPTPRVQSRSPAMAKIAPHAGVYKLDPKYAGKTNTATPTNTNSQKNTHKILKSKTVRRVGGKMVKRTSNTSKSREIAIQTSPNDRVNVRLMTPSTPGGFSRQPSVVDFSAVASEVEAVASRLTPRLARDNSALSVWSNKSVDTPRNSQNSFRTLTDRQKSEIDFSDIKVSKDTINKINYLQANTRNQNAKIKSIKKANVVKTIAEPTNVYRKDLKPERPRLTKRRSTGNLSDASEFSFSSLTEDASIDDSIKLKSDISIDFESVLSDNTDASNKDSGFVSQATERKQDEYSKHNTNEDRLDTPDVSIGVPSRSPTPDAKSEAGREPASNRSSENLLLVPMLAETRIQTLLPSSTANSPAGYDIPEIRMISATPMPISHELPIMTKTP